MDVKKVYEEWEIGGKHYRRVHLLPSFLHNSLDIILSLARIAKKDFRKIKNTDLEIYPNDEDGKNGHGFHLSFVVQDSWKIPADYLKTR
jgi:hypothetical protein